ncbi:MAG: large conductance mechanosensitive channel protein MscL [Firmicutes bacterium HGW-Firmicutes-21]|nr:MAG: large conductance mechanosensitive channel protein MscL [Firmicutes bacterium HGW-Firmicutes-21]
MTNGATKTKGFLNEFKTFVSQGNILDLAVGVVIGTAFRAIISSFVADIIMPAVGILVGGTDFSDLKHVLSEAVITDGVTITPEVAIRYGIFLKYIIDFIIIAFCMFVVVKVAMGFRKRLESIKKKEEEAVAAAPPAPSTEEKMLAALNDIRDSLQSNKGN